MILDYSQGGLRAPGIDVMAKSYKVSLDFQTFSQWKKPAANS